MRILLIGSGGREHAMAWKISRSPLCDRLYVAPGNAGTALCGENVDVQPNDKVAVGDFVRSRAVDMVVVGPEEPLVKGLADYFAADTHLRKVMFLGPSSEGARLEGSKAYAKAFMERHKIPSAAYRAFDRDQLTEAREFLGKFSPPYVLKADGLAAGKGVMICATREEAELALDEMLREGKFGEASSTVVIEEFLKGQEMSVFVLTDGETYQVLPAAKDYKRVGEDDTGTNTGGMGAVSPVPFAGGEVMRRIEDRIIQPTIEGIRKERIDYRGFIFFGLMLVDGNPYVIEYNVRLGDPETEVIIPRLESDLVELMKAACNGTLKDCTPVISPGYALTVMLTSGGYPAAYKKGYAIEGIEEVDGSQLFFAGVKKEADQLVTNGGRVIAVTSLAGDLESARSVSYANARVVDFKGKYYRRDIGKDLLQ
ncbi:MAG: phosphoribosylamine--glycine ligase [Bacteroidales bacterium]